MHLPTALTGQPVVALYVRTGSVPSLFTSQHPAKYIKNNHYHPTSL